MEYILFLSKIFVTAIYVSSLFFLCSFGLYRLYLSILHKKYRLIEIKPLSRFTSYPKVTIQLPIYNEMYVVERLISAVCKIDYPKDLLEIQVLDDSTDETSGIARNSVEKFKKAGFQIEFIHRDNRRGYKAGALEEGLKKASGEFVAIFDADFVPPADFLKKTIDYFTDPDVGIVQTRWGHLNLNYSILTKAQSILLDGHFAIEQPTRFKHGVFFNFNGTAGILRKTCIQSSGGWQHDTLTEDLDLSYRAQLDGWKLVYLKDVVSDAELPVDMNAFKSQQHRWAKGGIQTAKKLLPRILSRKDLPAKVKIESVFHLLGNLSYVLLLALLTFMVPMGYFWKSIGWEKVIIINLLTISAGTGSIFYFYYLTVVEVHGKDWKRFFKYIPVALALGAGLALNNSKAVFEALWGKESEFKRTPKFAVQNKRDVWESTSYVSSKEVTAFFEFMLGLLFLIQTVYAIYMGYIGWIPFLLLLQFGFIYISLYSFIHSWKRKRAL
ncbi:MAG: cellulose synthase family protein [Thermodesulfobacteriota bacterium]